MRSLRGSSGWQGRAFLSRAGARVRRKAGTDRGRPRRRRQTSPVTGCLCRSWGGTVRIMHAGDPGDHLCLPRVPHGKPLHCRRADREIPRGGPARARAHPGAYLLLEGKGLPIQYGILPVSQDEQALCVDHVRHVGDPVAAVIAREELTAFEALDLIDVDYEILTTISDPEEALATPEPRIHDYGEEG